MADTADEAGDQFNKTFEEAEEIVKEATGLDPGIFIFIFMIAVGSYWGYKKIMALKDHSGEQPWSSKGSGRALDFTSRERYNALIEKEGDTISDKKKEIALKVRGREAVKRYFGIQNERKDFAKIEHLLSPIVRAKEEAMFKEVDEEMEAIQAIAGEMKEGWNKTFLQECADALGQERRAEAAGGHSHDGKPCHGHGPPDEEEDHGHSHGGGAEHGHSHDGVPCHGHGPPKGPAGAQGGPPQNPGEVGQISLAISVPQATHKAGQNPLDGDPNEVLTVQRMITTVDGKKPLGSPKAIPRKNLRELLSNMNATMKK